MAITCAITYRIACESFSLVASRNAFVESDRYTSSSRFCSMLSDSLPAKWDNSLRQLIAISSDPFNRSYSNVDSSYLKSRLRLISHPFSSSMREFNQALLSTSRSVLEARLRHSSCSGSSSLSFLVW